MRQKVQVVPIITHDKKIMLSQDKDNKFSFGFTTLQPGKQASEAAARYLKTEFEIESHYSLDLLDVVTTPRKSANRTIDLISIVYVVRLMKKVGGEIGYAKWEQPPFEGLEFNDWSKAIVESTSRLKNTPFQKDGLLTEAERHSIANDPTAASASDDFADGTFFLYSDGGSRGNPGHSAAGFVILDIDQKVVAKGGTYLGITTSSMAEYQALKLGLETAASLGIQNLRCRLDSNMIVRQMIGENSVNNRDLKPISESIFKLRDQFRKIEFEHVHREFNSISDDQVNQILNKQLANY